MPQENLQTMIMQTFIFFGGGGGGEKKCIMGLCK